MIDPRRFVAVLATLVLVLAACSGSRSAPSGPSDSADAPAQTQAADPGEPAADVCALVTDEELAGILGQPVQTTVFAGPPDTCDIQSTDGAPLAAFVLTTMGGVAASTVYEAVAADPGSSDIGGIGEKASYNPTQGSLVILKNGSVLTVAVFDDGASDEAARLELMKQIGSIAAGRM